MIPRTFATKAMEYVEIYYSNLPYQMKEAIYNAFCDGALFGSSISNVRENIPTYTSNTIHKPMINGCSPGIAHGC